MKLTDFDIYKDLLKERSGLVLSADKAYLLESRLNPVAKKWEMASLDMLTNALKGVPDEALVTDVIEAMTTNETSFFRDTRPFDIFREHVLPYMMKNRAAQRSIKTWCAAASSGQEPYSLNMLMREQGNTLSNWNTPILGTDISREILEQAGKGIYTQFEVQRGMPIQMLMKYFTQIGEKWAISDDLKKNIKYQQFNLLNSMAGLGTFDIIFCRNVLIYFDDQTKTDVLTRMAKQLAPDGFLFLGGAETVLGITDLFAPVPDKRGLYALKNGPHLNVAKAS